MTVAKRIALLMATSALAATLSGCEALDFLNFNKASSGITDSPATAQTPVTQASAGASAQQPAPFDLSGAQPMLPNSSMNIQSSAANAALIGSTMGASPSGFGGLMPGVPTTTTTPAPYSYGAQPNPYAPRLPFANTTAVIGFQQPVQQPVLNTVAQPSAQLSPLYGNPYQPAGLPNQAMNTATTIARTPAAAPLTAGLPASSVASTSQSVTTMPQPGTLDPANLSKSTITAIQTALKSRGLYSDTVDGVWGSKSKAAMTAYLATRGEPAVSLDTLFSLGVSL